MLRSLDLTTEILRLRWLIAAETFQLCFARSIPPTKELRLKCRQLEWGLAARRFQLAYARHVQALNQKGFNPDQPRMPAGQPDGSQWTSGGNGAGNGAPPDRDIIRDPTGQLSWDKYVNNYQPDGSLAKQMVTNRDGSTIRSEFAGPRDNADWDERHTVAAADGAITTFQNAGLEQTIFDSEGQPVSLAVWTGNGPEQQAIVQRLPRGGSSSRREGAWRRADAIHMDVEPEFGRTNGRVRFFVQTPLLQAKVQRTRRSGSVN